ncbi:4-hydroxy-tetrahydrodipicolinate synthase [Aliiglaciecola sp. 3_MG-2023]|uniref:4-hydroxy-tetrahydrodipicolinate synthase n=1 Tax=Aliiglaciecola sp. 3_MG-2023 TaxID=3062644 RepID=UPI0026E327F1|nr:4-hydroxy-tetrahydrodipicolinate synthase [Aliiglaciecola sp. 3_MG-2023]MDO6693719.1 4-hydroxy-tetrahydrodipicolinate synthase [Aliiglaciecola sp. 3_MG-2023]
MFKGSFVALVTPMHPDGEVDYVGLKKLVEFHVENGTHGLVSVGTTGESATLPFEEHIEVVKKTVEYANNAIPVIAGSGANSTSEAIFLSQQLANTGIAGFLSVVPYYNKPQQKGMIAHFEAIADATDLPVLLYNVPGRTVADMLPETVAVLAKHKNIVGLKDATGDMARLKQTQALVPDDFLLLSGDDLTSCEFLCNGGHGVISVTANVVPAEMAKMCELAAAKDFAEAKKVDQSVAALHDALFIEPNPVLPKWVLYKMGLIDSAFLRLPLILPELQSKNVIEDVMRATGITING